MQQLPQAREFRHVRELDGELVIVDDVLDVAHRLRPDAARIWRACDGAADPAAIARTAGVPQPTADAALAELCRLGLLEAPAARALDTRRSMLRKAVLAGAGASVGLSLVSSVLLPTPAQAFNSQPGANNGNGTGNGHGQSGANDDAAARSFLAGAPAPTGTTSTGRRHRKLHHRKHHRRHMPHGRHHHHQARHERKRHRRHG